MAAPSASMRRAAVTRAVEAAAAAPLMMSPITMSEVQQLGPPELPERRTRPNASREYAWERFAEQFKSDPAKYETVRAIQTKDHDWLKKAAKYLSITVYTENGGHNAKHIDDLMREVVAKVTGEYWGKLREDWMTAIDRKATITIAGEVPLDPNMKRAALDEYARQLGLSTSKKHTKAELYAKIKAEVEKRRLAVKQGEALAAAQQAREAGRRETYAEQIARAMAFARAMDAYEESDAVPVPPQPQLPSVMISEPEMSLFETLYQVQRYRPEVDYFGTFDTLFVKFFDVPPNEYVLAALAMWMVQLAKTSSLRPEMLSREISTPKQLKDLFTAIDRNPVEAQGWKVHMRMTGYAALHTTDKTTGERGKDDDKFKSDPDLAWNMPAYEIFDLSLGSVMILGHITPELFEKMRDWLAKANEAAMNTVTKSDMFAEVEVITQLDFVFKFIPSEAHGYTILDDDVAKHYQGRIYSPVTNADCFFACLAEFERLALEQHKPSLGFTQSFSDLKRELKIGPGIKLAQVSQIANLANPQLTFFIHEPVDGPISIFQHQCSRCGRYGSGERIIHLGYVFDHFFLINDTSVLVPDAAGHCLRPSDFIEVKDQDEPKQTQPHFNEDELAMTPVTDKEISAWKMIALERLCISEEKMAKKREDYWQQDQRAGRANDCPIRTLPNGKKRRQKPDDFITVQDMFEAIEAAQGKCVHCNESLTNANWVLDRIDSSRMHVKGNVQLSCQRCNCRKRGMSDDDFRLENKPHTVVFFDIETIAQPVFLETGRIKREHVIYAYSWIYGQPLKRKPKPGLDPVEREKAEAKEEEEWGETLRRQADRTVYYGEDAGQHFVAAIKAEEARLERIVNAKVEAYKESYIRGMRRRGKKIDVAELERQMENKRRHLIDKLCVYWYAHNGGRYDTQFVLKSAGLEFKSIINSNGILQLTLRSGLIQFRDTKRILNGSLEKLCRDFKLPQIYSKTQFPHDFMNRDIIPPSGLSEEEKRVYVNKRRFYYVGQTPSSEYWPGHKVPAEFKVKDYVFDVAAISKHYNKLDVVSLCMIFFKFELLLDETFPELHLHLSDFLTAPHLSYSIVASHLPRSVGVIRNCCVSRFMRRAVQGGRCIVQKARFTSDSYEQFMSLFEADPDLSQVTYERKEEVKKRFEEERQAKLREVYEACIDWCTDVDACSLYPSAMALFSYPVGQPFWMPESDHEKLRAALNGVTKETDVNTFPYIGIVECDIEYTRNCVFPLLSKTTKKQLEYTLEPMSCNKCTVDLIEAVRRTGVRVTQIHHALLWPEREKIFEKIIKRLYAIKRDMKAVAPIISEIAKLLMNSSYGKMLQRLIEEEWEVFSSDSVVDLARHREMWSKGKIKSDKRLANRKQMMSLIKRERRVEKHPVHLGVFVLAFSKVIMNQCIEAFDGFNNWRTTFFMTDTDSLHVHRGSLEMLKELCPHIVGEEMGQLHDDIDEVAFGKIIASRFVRPKLYIDVIVGYDKDAYKKESRRVAGTLELMDLRRVPIVMRTHKRAKGVRPGSRESMSLDDYDAMIRGCTHRSVERRFCRKLMVADEPAIDTRFLSKIMNQEQWVGRIFDIATDRYVPITSETRAEHERACAESRKQRRYVTNTKHFQELHAKMMSSFMSRNGKMNQCLAGLSEGLATLSSVKQELRRLGAIESQRLAQS